MHFTDGSMLKKEIKNIATMQTKKNMMTALNTECPCYEFVSFCMVRYTAMHANQIIVHSEH